MERERLKAYIAIILSMSFFAFSYVWFKVANEVFPPFTIVFLRLLVSAIILWVFLSLSGRVEKIKEGDHIYFFLIAFCEPFLYFLFEAHGLSMVSSTVASVVIATIPVFTAIGALIIFREKLSRLNYAGVVVSFTGIIVFMIAGESNLSFHPLGILLMFMAVICATAYSLLLRRLINSYGPIFIVAVQNAIALILFTPFFLLISGSGISSLVWSAASLTAILRLAVFASSAAFILLAYSVRRIGITRANLFANIIPVLTALYAFYTFGESFTIEKMAGIAIMITGLYMSQVNGRHGAVGENMHD